MAEDDTDASKSIPVFTLFNDGGSAEGDNNVVMNPSAAKPKNFRQSSEPELCNVFAEGSSDQSSDDIFSKISDEKADKSSATVSSTTSSSTLTAGSSSSSNYVSQPNIEEKCTPSFTAQQNFTPHVSGNSNKSTASGQTPLEKAVEKMNEKYITSSSSDSSSSPSSSGHLSGKTSTDLSTTGSSSNSSSSADKSSSTSTSQSSGTEVISAPSNLSPLELAVQKMNDKNISSSTSDSSANSSSSVDKSSSSSTSQSSRTEDNSVPSDLSPLELAVQKMTDKNMGNSTSDSSTNSSSSADKSSSNSSSQSSGSGDKLATQKDNEKSSSNLTSASSSSSSSSDHSTLTSSKEESSTPLHTQNKSLPLNKSVDSFIVEELEEENVESSAIDTSTSNSTSQSSGDQDKSTSSKQTSPTESDEKLNKKPIIATKSFTSINSFSIEPDEDNTGDDESTLVSEMGGLTIQNVKDSVPNKADDHSSPLSPPIGGTETLFSNVDKKDKVGKKVDFDDDDPFAAALSNSALDRRRDAWLPSLSTRETLMFCLENQYAPDLDIDKLTTPGLSTSERLEDPVKKLVHKLTGSESVVQRENLTVEDVSQDRIGIQKLMETGNHRAAGNLCAKLLTFHGQGFGKATQQTKNTPNLLWLWYARIYILTKLKLYEPAATELSHFGSLDNPDLYFEFYPKEYPGRRGSMVPFEFRLLHAEFPRYVEKPEECLRRLHFLFATCEKIIHGLKCGNTEMGEPLILDQSDLEASIRLWTKRKVDVMYCMANVLVELKDYVLAMQMSERILDYYPQDVVKIQSGIGRLFLHIGDIRAAQQRFTVAEKGATNDLADQLQLLLNRGFMYIGTNNWREAYTQFQAVLDIDEHNIIALNNKAVCLLYLGKLKDAIDVLENGTAQQSVPEVQSKVHNINRHQALLQGLIGNLSTLYELESSQFMIKKRGLFLKHIAQQCGDSFETSCFKDI